MQRPRALCLTCPQDIRERYYNMMIELHTLQRSPMDLAADWEAMYRTKGFEGTAKGMEVLSRLLSLLPHTHTTTATRHTHTHCVFLVNYVAGHRH